MWKVHTMDTSIFSDPIKIGPGIWFIMHTNAVKAITDPLKMAFEINVNAICDNFKCKKCQPHFRKFIDTHPFINYWNIRDAMGRDIGFFQWTWELHNEVNKFLRKYQPSLQEAYNFFSDTEAGACFNCGNNVTGSSNPHTGSHLDLPLKLRESEGITSNLVQSPAVNKIPPFNLVSEANRAGSGLLVNSLNQGALGSPPLPVTLLSEPLVEQRSRAIPPILTLYRTSDNIKPQPFRLVTKTPQ